MHVSAIVLHSKISSKVSDGFFDASEPQNLQERVNKFTLQLWQFFFAIFNHFIQFFYAENFYPLKIEGGKGKKKHLNFKGM